MSPAEARAAFLDNCKPGDRGSLERHGEIAAVAAILSITAHLEAEARRIAGMYAPHSDGRNTFVIFADKIADLTADRVALHVEQAA